MCAPSFLVCAHLTPYVREHMQHSLEGTLGHKSRFSW